MISTRFHRSALVLTAVIGGAIAVATAEDAAEQGSKPAIRTYALYLTSPPELEDIADAGRALNRMLIDAWYRGFGRGVHGTVGSILEGTWNFLVTFNTSQWPHELGHWVRARQLGGDFRIVRYGFPAPIATMEIPLAVSAAFDDALASVGGHEVNFIMKRTNDAEFYARGYGFSDDLIHGFIQGALYPFYALVLVPRDPADPQTWLQTAGDPVESTLIAWRRHSGKAPVRPDGTVDPELVSLYRETVAASLLAVALDPLTYTGISAFRHPMSLNGGAMHPRFLIERDDFGWTYSTQFNPSPLGYELYVTNHIRSGDTQTMAVYVKIGRPFRNVGAGIFIPSVLRWRNVRFDIGLEVFDQVLYGPGLCVSARTGLKIGRSWEIIMRGYAKSVGYVAGRRIEEGEQCRREWRTFSNDHSGRPLLLQNLFKRSTDML